MSEDMTNTWDLKHFKVLKVVLHMKNIFQNIILEQNDSVLKKRSSHAIFFVCFYMRIASYTP